MMIEATLKASLISSTAKNLEKILRLCLRMTALLCLRMMVFRQLLILIFPTVIGFDTALAQPKCIGKNSDKVKARIIYLHGIDTAMPGPQELKNRQVLSELAKKHDLQIALPRAKKTCRKNKVCWQQGNRNEVKQTFERVKKQAETACFQNQPTTSILGFSNGGYLATKIAHFCLAKLDWIIAIGSSGDARQITDDLSKCPLTVLMLGTRDITLAKAKRYVHNAQKKSMKVRLDVFDGGHEMNLASLSQILIRLLGKTKQK